MQSTPPPWSRAALPSTMGSSHARARPGVGCILRPTNGLTSDCGSQLAAGRLPHP